MRPILVVVSAPSLQLFLRVRKGQEPMSVQTFRSEAAVEGFDVRVIRWLARSTGSSVIPRGLAVLTPQCLQVLGAQDTASVEHTLSVIFATHQQGAADHRNDA